MQILKKSTKKNHYYYVFTCWCCHSKIRVEEEELNYDGWGDVYFKCPVCHDYNFPTFVESHKRKEKIDICEEETQQP